MILVRSGWLWCSLCVRGNGIRIETIRFGLLIVLTVALASVALRIGSHSHPTSSGRPAHNLTPIPSPSVSASASARPLHPAVQPTHAATSPARGSGGSGGSSGAGGGSAAQELPVTGWDATVKLGALAFVLIGGGILTLRAGGTGRRRQRATVQD